MIARPLNLAAHLRPEPRHFDFLFLVNAGLLALFFSLFGSRFVLSPGLGVNFEVPEMAGAQAGAATTTHQLVISVKQAGLIFVDEGKLNMEQLREWLKKKGAMKVGDKTRASLLVLASAGVQVSEVTEITSAAQAAGFARVQWGAQEPGPSKPPVP